MRYLTCNIGGNEQVIYSSSNWSWFSASAELRENRHDLLLSLILSYRYSLPTKAYWLLTREKKSSESNDIKKISANPKELSWPVFWSSNQSMYNCHRQQSFLLLVPVHWYTIILSLCTKIAPIQTASWYTTSSFHTNTKELILTNLVMECRSLTRVYIHCSSSQRPEPC